MPAPEAPIKHASRWGLKAPDTSLNSISSLPWLRGSSGLCSHRKKMSKKKKSSKTKKTKKSMKMKKKTTKKKEKTKKGRRAMHRNRNKDEDRDYEFEQG